MLRLQRCRLQKLDTVMRNEEAKLCETLASLRLAQRTGPQAVRRGCQGWAGGADQPGVHAPRRRQRARQRLLVHGDGARHRGGCAALRPPRHRTRLEDHQPRREAPRDRRAARFRMPGRAGRPRMGHCPAGPEPLSAGDLAVQPGSAIYHAAQHTGMRINLHQPAAPLPYVTRRAAAESSSESSAGIRCASLIESAFSHAHTIRAPSLHISRQSRQG